ncbi:MAG: patatin-like phospholipase family protein [Spirochaetales bacterium]|nr:patatin-like phospholipase family protein [Spirochaetales bacterium]
MKRLEASHLLGDFLVRNRVLRPAALSHALEQQRRISYNLSLLSLAESLLAEDELAVLHARLQVNDETLEEALLALELLAPGELAELKTIDSDFRIPLGVIFQKTGTLNPGAFRDWLTRFENQKFDQKQLRDTLKRIPIFAHLPARELSKICSRLTYKYYTAGEYVYRSGDKSSGVYIIDSGLVRILIDIKQENRITGSCQNGELFGLPGVMAGGVRQENALAITDTVIWRISNQDFLRLVTQDSTVARVAAEHLGKIYQNAIHHLRHRTRINESKISILFVAPRADDEWRMVGHVYENLLDTLPPNSLILSTLPGWKPTGVRFKRSSDVPSAVPVPTSRPDIFFVGMRRIEQNAIVDTRTADALRYIVHKYSSIILLASPGSREFRRFIMGLCRRSAILVRHEFPDHLKFLKGTRDRIYQLATGNPGRDLANRNLLTRECVQSLVPHLILPSNEKITAGRIARWFAGKSVGIAFGGGGARALSHLGVLEVLEKIGLQIDMISGASAGAHVGGMLACGYSREQMLEYFRREVMEKRGHPFNDFALPLRALIRGKKYHNLLRRAFGDRDMATVEMPFFPLATNLQNGKGVIIQTGKIADAVLASGSVPGVFPPVITSQGVLADGGMVNNIPAYILKEWDTSYVISINTSIDPARSLFEPGSIGRIMLQALDIFMEQTIKDHIDHTDFEIKPDVDTFSVTDHRRGQEIIEAGRLSARRILPQLLRSLKKHGIVESGSVLGL